jgi:DNA-3-methyladenine glycosylase I
MNERSRCQWVSDDNLYVKYHDEEWGKPCHDDSVLFEFLILEGAQAGLSWITILKKRENYRKAFANFDPEKIAQFGTKETNDLLKNEGIVRNKLKIAAAIENAKCFLLVQKEFGSFDQYIWSFVAHKTIKVPNLKHEQVPSKTKESDAMSADLKKRGFKFVGSTICYAFMQACGLVDDHIQDCFLSTGSQP